MNIGILLPGFSGDENDWALPVQQHLARELAKTDDVRILALRYPFRRDRYIVSGAQVTSLGAGSYASGIKRLRLWADALNTLRNLHAEKPFDVLHAMWADETGLIGAWAGRLLGVPSVVSILGGELVGLRDIGYGLQLSAFSRWIVGQALRSDTVISASRYVDTLIAGAGYRRTGRIVRGTLGVDTELFKPDGTIPDPRRIINVASLVPVKDQATLLRAVARLDDVTLDIVGVGTEEGRLRALAADLGIAARVNFIGAVKHTDLPAYYRRAALKVLTSRHEILAMATLEAAACGVPVVSTNVGTLPDHPDIGVVVPVGDDAALADAIRGLLDDEGRRVALGEGARGRVERKFSVQVTAAGLRELYENE
ncbi:MAG: glycosyltransferase [Chloroflexota bacterium]|nr:glycosyltransferase [Chloroflexota bacterium]